MESREEEIIFRLAEIGDLCIALGIKSNLSQVFDYVPYCKAGIQSLISGLRELSSDIAERGIYVRKKSPEGKCVYNPNLELYSEVRCLIGTLIFLCYVCLNPATVRLKKE